MTAHLNDQEQVELLKTLWKKYANIVVMLIVVIVLVIAGWHLYRNHHRAEVSKASLAYQTLLDTMSSNKTKSSTIKAQAKYIIQHYSRSGYAILSAMLLAAEEVKSGKLDSAKTHLQWALAHTDNIQYQAIITLRLARIEISQGNAKQALVLLNKPPKGFTATYHLVRGQAYVALGQLAEAKKNYETALKILPESDPYHQVILTYLSGLTKG